VNKISLQTSPMNRSQPNTSKAFRVSGRVRAVSACALAISILSACASTTPKSETNASATLFPRAAASAPLMIAADASVRTGAAPSASDLDRIKLVLGSNQTFRAPAAKSPTTPAETGVPLTLTFENGDIREIVRNLLGDLLGENFIIDPAVTGTVTVRTAKGIRRSDIIPTLEVLLRTVKAVLVRDGDYWRVLPEGGVNLGTVPPRLELRPGAGNSVVILSVKHIGAKELEKIILPFVKAGSPAAIRTDEIRNLLFLSGTEAEVRNMLEIAEMFDVNVLAGMSFLLYPLESSDVKTMAADWERIFPANANPFALSE